MKNFVFMFVFAFLLTASTTAMAGFLDKGLNMLGQDAKQTSKPAQKPSSAPLPEPAAPQQSTGTQMDTKSGFSVFVPAGWKVNTDTAGNFSQFAPKSTAFSVVTNDYGAGFPVKASLDAYTKQAKSEFETDKLSAWQELSLGNAKGVLREESAPKSDDDIRRITFQGYTGTIGVNIVASCKAGDFNKKKPQLMQIVKSVKF